MQLQTFAALLAASRTPDAFISPRGCSRGLSRQLRRAGDWQGAGCGGGGTLGRAHCQAPLCTTKNENLYTLQPVLAVPQDDQQKQQQKKKQEPPEPASTRQDGAAPGPPPPRRRSPALAPAAAEEEQERDLFVPILVVVSLFAYCLTAAIAWVEYNS